MQSNSQVQLSKEETVTISPHFAAIDAEKARLQARVEGLELAKRVMLAALLDRRKAGGEDAQTTNVQPPAE